MDVSFQTKWRGKMWGRQSVGPYRARVTDGSGKFLASRPTIREFFGADSELNESSRQIVGSTL